MSGKPRVSDTGPDFATYNNYDDGKIYIKMIYMKMIYMIIYDNKA